MLSCPFHSFFCSCFHLFGFRSKRRQMLLWLVGKNDNSVSLVCFIPPANPAHCTHVLEILFIGFVSVFSDKNYASRFSHIRPLMAAVYSSCVISMTVDPNRGRVPTFASFRKFIVPYFLQLFVFAGRINQLGLLVFGSAAFQKSFLVFLVGARYDFQSSTFKRFPWTRIVRYFSFII